MNQQRIFINKQAELIAKLEKRLAELEKERVERVDEIEPMVVAEVRAHEIYKALGTQAKLEIVKIEGWQGYYIELSEKRYRELVSDE